MGPPVGIVMLGQAEWVQLIYLQKTNGLPGVW